MSCFGLVVVTGHLAVTGKIARTNGYTPFLLKTMNRKFYVCFVSVLLGGILSAGAAKKVVIKAGTQIPLQAVNSVKAADVTEGLSWISGQLMR